MPEYTQPPHISEELWNEIEADFNDEDAIDKYVEYFRVSDEDGEPRLPSQEELNSWAHSLPDWVQEKAEVVWEKSQTYPKKDYSAESQAST